MTYVDEELAFVWRILKYRVNEMAPLIEEVLKRVGFTFGKPTYIDP